MQYVGVLNEHDLQSDTSSSQNIKLTYHKTNSREARETRSVDIFGSI